MGVDLEHYAVNFVGQSGAAGFGGVDEARHLLDRGDQLSLGVDAEAESGQRIERCALALRPVIALDQQKVCVKVQAAIGDDGGFECAQGSGGGVTRIHGWSKALLLALFVQSQECGFGHHRLAANFKGRRQVEFSQLFSRNGQRDATNGANIRGDILAGLAVAARDAGGEARAACFRSFIAQGHAQAVHLQLGHILDRERAGQFAAASLPGGQLLGRVGVVQREHGAGVRHLAKALGRLAAHALGGRVGGDELGVRCLDAFEFVHQRVVGGVADFRRVENVIQVLVAAQFGAQFVGALGSG